MKLASRIRRTAGLTAASLGLLTALALRAEAQPTPVFLLQAGDPVAGVGPITKLGPVVVNSAGEWIVAAACSTGSAASDEVRLRNGVLDLREGAPLAAPAGATVDAFGPFDLDDNGNLFQILFLAGTSGLTDDTGLFLNGNLLLQEGSAVTAPGFGGGTVYRGFLNVKCDASGSRAVVVVAVDDPAVPGALELALLRLDVSGGAITGQTLIARQGDVLAGQTRPVVSFGTGRHQSAVNGAGDVLFFADLAGDPATDGTIYLNGTLLAQEGSASPDPGRNYQRLSSRGLDLNDAGETVFQADLDDVSTADDAVLVQSGAIAVREGPFPSFPSGVGAILDFGSPDAPVAIDNAGAVAWLARASSPFGDPISLLFRAGTTVAYSLFGQIEGVSVTSVVAKAGAFSQSRANDWVLFRVGLGPTNALIDALAILPGTSTQPVDAPAVPVSSSFLRVFPNPAAGAVGMRFALDRDAPVSLRVFDVRGRLVETVLDGARPRGEHSVGWNGTDTNGRRVAPGTYFVRLRAGDREQVARVTLVE